MSSDAKISVRNRARKVRRRTRKERIAKMPKIMDEHRAGALARPRHPGWRSLRRDGPASRSPRLGPGLLCSTDDLRSSAPPDCFARLFGAGFTFRRDLQQFLEERAVVHHRLTEIFGGGLATL